MQVSDRFQFEGLEAIDGATPPNFIPKGYKENVVNAHDRAWDKVESLIHPGDLLYIKRSGGGSILSRDEKTGKNVPTYGEKGIEVLYKIGDVGYQGGELKIEATVVYSNDGRRPVGSKDYFSNRMELIDLTGIVFKSDEAYVSVITPPGRVFFYPEAWNKNTLNLFPASMDTNNWMPIVAVIGAVAITGVAIYYFRRK